MRPRDLDAKSHRLHNTRLALDSGLSVYVGWSKRGLVFLSIKAETGRCDVPIPRHIFNQICDWYEATCDADFWSKPEQDISENFGKYWTVQASSFPERAGTDGVTYQAFHLINIVAFLANGVRALNLIIRPDDFEKIILWYNGGPTFKTKFYSVCAGVIPKEGMAA